MICQASRRWSTATTSRLYSSASSRAWSVTVSSTGSTSTHRAAPGPVTPLPIRARAPALSTAPGPPPHEAADALDGRDHAVRRVAVLEPRGEQQLAVAAGAGRVDRGLGGLVERDRHDHAGQDDQVGQEQHREREA